MQRTALRRPRRGTCPDCRGIFGLDHHATLKRHWNGVDLFRCAGSGRRPVRGSAR